MISRKISNLALRPRALSSHSRTAMEDELSCPVCCEIFSDPVVLKCSHSFCKTCLHQIWNKKATRRECPVCRRKCSLTEPPVSLALKNVCDALQKEQGGRTPVAAESSGCGAVGGKTEECCPAHGESVKLYCEDDAELLCCVCQTSRKHQGHSICPLEEAAQELKVRVTTFERLMSQDTERQIKDQFAELHQFLQKEEAARLALLQEEEEQKRQVTKKRTDCITLDILTLSHAIIAIENEIASNDMTFLQNFKNTTNPEKVPGALISVAKHVGSLKYRVWEKMQAITIWLLSPVTLDPNTAYCWLSLSRDLTSVTNTGARQQLPDNPERFDHFVFVLGSEGFTEGRHAWEVEVGDKSDWVLGVVNETIERKSKITGCPKGGFWTISHSDGEYMAMTSPRTKLSLQGPLERVRVQLDCDLGQVSFSNPVDMTPIYTFSDHKFTETMFPFFCPGANINGNNSGPLKICPVKVAVWNSATW
uniref:RING-type E3 ubiquitin transferase n=1 Tax=Denticeps clupeoides TaxID=299321 RepID=A0AAY4BWU1_9TELE